MLNGCPLWLCPWKGTASTGTRGEVFQSLILPTSWVNQWLSYKQLCSRALRLGWETMKRYPRANPGPIANVPFGNRTGNSPTLQVEETTKSSPRRTHCKLWVCFFGWVGFLLVKELVRTRGTGCGRQCSSWKWNYSTHRSRKRFKSLCTRGEVIYSVGTTRGQGIIRVVVVVLVLGRRRT